MNKRALMVAFHFPPQAGSSGILRTLNFVKNLPSNGWQPAVLSAHPRAYESTREDLLSTIPAGTEVIRAFALDAARHLAIAGKYPQVLALPDRWATWWLGGVRAGLRAIRAQRPDVVWSTYPISTAHMIGASLAKKTGLPWIADFRDPMLNPGYPSEPLQRRIRQRIESETLARATFCVFTTQRAADNYAERYPQAAGKCRVIENGYDEDAFTDAIPARSGVADDTLLFLHSGIIYPEDRDPSAFFAAIARLIEQGSLSRDKVCIRFRAPSHTTEVAALAAKYNLADVVDIAPPIPYRQAIAEMLGADFLVVFQGAQFNAQIPAKIYEYLRAGRPLLALTDPAGDTATQLRPFREIGFADIADAGQIATTIVASLAARQTPGHAEGLADNMHAVRRYSRITQAGTLAALFDEARTLAASRSR